MRKFPRTNEDMVVIQGKIWNALVDEVERLGRLVVAPPLRLQNVAGGMVLSLSSRRAGLSLYNGSNVAVLSPPLLAIPVARGMTNILEFQPDSVSTGTPGASLSLTAGASNRVGIFWNGTVWQQSYVRFHS